MELNGAKWIGKLGELLHQNPACEAEKLQVGIGMFSLLPKEYLQNVLKMQVLKTVMKRLLIKFF